MCGVHNDSQSLPGSSKKLKIEIIKNAAKFGLFRLTLTQWEYGVHGNNTKISSFFFFLHCKETR